MYSLKNEYPIYEYSSAGRRHLSDINVTDGMTLYWTVPRVATKANLSVPWRSGIDYVGNHTIDSTIPTAKSYI